MIKAEVVFDGDLIYCKGKLISFQQGSFKDYWEVDGVGDIFDTQEQAIAYCMEKNNANP